jgi:tRNA dimethylallyltransferase
MCIDPSKPKIVIICGPTGIGKTSLAIQLAQYFGGEIISADSMQIYQYMDIGTAKPTPDERAMVRHHLIDIVEPDQSFDAARFSSLAHEVIQTLHKRHLLPLIAGGTGLYIKALVHGLFRSRSADPEILRQLGENARQFGSQALYDRLLECDPQAAEKIHPNDTFRIIRALEVFQSTCKPISAYQRRHQFADQPYHVLKMGLYMPREALYNRINHRVDRMLADGLLDEVRKLLDTGYDASLKSMQAIGYRHMLQYLSGELDWDEAVRTMKRDTRRYAKRQMTWFRKDSAIEWIERDDDETALKQISHFLRSPQKETV